MFWTVLERGKGQVLLHDCRDFPAPPLSAGAGLGLRCCSAQQMMQAVSQHPNTPAHGVTFSVEDFILLPNHSILKMESPVLSLVAPG